MNAVVRQIALPEAQRVICVSDIHGNLPLFQRLLARVSFCESDALILVGDLYTKGAYGRETLSFIMQLCERPNVWAVRGNCDWLADWLSDEQRAWLESLPHILESDGYLFVHGGLTIGDLSAQQAMACMKNDAFMEQGLRFDKYVVTGHWPTLNYTHEIGCCNPIVDGESRIIAIDGGNVVKAGGQLNAFIMKDGAFSFEAVDDLPTMTVARPQHGREGTIHMTWLDRYIEVLEAGSEFSLCRQLKTDRRVMIPNRHIVTDEDGATWGYDSTDHWLRVEAGDEVSVIERFKGRILAKKDGVIGWIET